MPTSDTDQQGIAPGLAKDSADSADVRDGILEKYEVHLTREFHVVLLEIRQQQLPQVRAIFHGPIHLSPKARWVQLLSFRGGFEYEGINKNLDVYGPCLNREC